MPVLTTEIYINGTLFLQSSSGLDIPYEVSSTGIEADGTVWTYSGIGIFLGFSTTQGATTPDENLAVGDSYAFVSGGTVYLYAVEAPQPTAKTVINGLTPTKKMFGTTEIIKEVVNGVTVYEKQSTPSYAVTVSYTNGTISNIVCADDTSGTNKVLIAEPNTASHTFNVPQNKPYIMVTNTVSGNNAVNSISGATFIEGFAYWDNNAMGAIIQITADNANISLQVTRF